MLVVKALILILFLSTTVYIPSQDTGYKRILLDTATIDLYYLQQQVFMGAHGHTIQVSFLWKIPKLKYLPLNLWEQASLLFN